VPEQQQITYTGPVEGALAAATALADAAGVDLVGQERVHGDDPAVAMLVLTVSATTDDLLDAVATVRPSIPPGATLRIGRPG
jgi:hypothetical protein